MNKGILILSEARSGSNWLGSLLELTGQLGHPEEWFTEAFGPEGGGSASAQEWIDHALRRSSTENGFFAIKLFVPHVFEFHDRYGIDLVRWFLDNRETLPVRLSRRDRLRQAISLVRGLQTRKWRSSTEATGSESYDFAAICRAVARIDRSYAYWQSCETLYGVTMPEFVYEDMVPSPSPFLKAVAEHAGVEIGEVAESPLKVQRDRLTEEWLDRFAADREGADLVEFGCPVSPPKRSLSNFIRLASGRPVKPYHYQFRILERKGR